MLFLLSCIFLLRRPAHFLSVLIVFVYPHFQISLYERQILRWIMSFRLLHVVITSGKTLRPGKRMSANVAPRPAVADCKGSAFGLQPPNRLQFGCRQSNSCKSLLTVLDVSYLSGLAYTHDPRVLKVFDCYGYHLPEVTILT